MKVRLHETVHETGLPVGIVGEVFMDDEGYMRFIPDNPIKGYGLPHAAYIDNKRYEVLNGPA